MPRIVTHGGRAHCDEIYAIALIIAVNKFRIDEVEILRRDPAPLELELADIFVVDVGMRYEPDKNNYDHHQYRGGKASFRLVADVYGLDQDAKELFKWWEYKNDMDVNGPSETAKKFGVPDTSMFQSPIDHMFISAFENDPNDMFVKEFLRRLGDGLVAGLARYRRLMDIYDHHVQIVKENDMEVAVFMSTEVNCLNTWLDKNAPDVAVTITKDARSGALSMYRVGDNPRINFSWLASDPEVSFAHKGGFLLTTKSIDTNWRRLLRAATVS